MGTPHLMQGSALIERSPHLSESISTDYLNYLSNHLCVSLAKTGLLDIYLTVQLDQFYTSPPIEVRFKRSLY